MQSTKCDGTEGKQGPPWPHSSGLFLREVNHGFSEFSVKRSIGVIRWLYAEGARDRLQDVHPGGLFRLRSVRASLRRRFGRFGFRPRTAVRSFHRKRSLDKYVLGEWPLCGTHYYRQPLAMTGHNDGTV